MRALEAQRGNEVFEVGVKERGQGLGKLRGIMLMLEPQDPKLPAFGRGTQVEFGARLGDSPFQCSISGDEAV